MTRSEIRDTLNKRDMAAIKLGQASAKRYLRSKEKPPTSGNIRAGLAFSIMMVATIVIGLTL